MTNHWLVVHSPRQRTHLTLFPPQPRSLEDNVLSGENLLLVRYSDRVSRSASTVFFLLCVVRIQDKVGQENKGERCSLPLVWLAPWPSPLLPLAPAPSTPLHQINALPVQILLIMRCVRR